MRSSSESSNIKLIIVKHQDIPEDIHNELENEEVKKDTGIFVRNTVQHLIIIHLPTFLYPYALKIMFFSTL